MQQPDIKEWINLAPDITIRRFRQAVHTILAAIAGSPALQTNMIMKGGVLLALGYRSPRYTKDIDFSTAIKRPDFDLEHFRTLFDASLIDVVEFLGYGLDCRVQRCTQKPKGDDHTFPTIQLHIGYATKGSANHKRLLAYKSTEVIRIDYSLNEPVEETELFELEEGNTIRTYSLVELISEKFRALLQQEVRNRIRRQDIYDLHYVLNEHPLCNTPAKKERILARLIEKSRIRSLQVDSLAMSNSEIRRRSEAEYNMLSSEIDGELPPFDEVYALVETFYCSLPWKNS